MSGIQDLPKHDDLFWPVIRAFRKLDGSADNDQLVETVIEILGLPDELTALPHKSGPQSEIGYRIAWVKSWLKWGGIVDNPSRGVWVLTERGRGATEEEVNDVWRRRRAEAAAKRKTKVEIASEDNVVEAPETEELEKYSEDDWQAALLDVLKGMEAKVFERLARLLLLSLNFSHVEVVGRSGDGGIDLLEIIRLNNVLSFRVLVQCKRYKDTVGPGEIHNFRGAMQGRTDKGIFITSGRYTREARHEASRDGVPAVDLIDGEGLCGLLKDLGLGVETRMVERVTINHEFFEGV